MTGVRVRETVPDTFLDRADEVINVDVTVEELHSRLRQGKIYKPEKVEQALKDGFTSGSGMGLGLGGSKRLVNEFSIESEVGKGTKVTIARWR